MIDTHVHLDMAEFDLDLDLVLKAAEGVRAFVIPGADVRTLDRAVHIAGIYDNVYFAPGLHPNIVRDDLDEVLCVLDSKCGHAKCVAVGECGLDYYRFDSACTGVGGQIRAFRSQIELSIKHDLPLILHVRDNTNNFLASETVISILDEYAGSSNLRGVFHCYNAYPGLLSFRDRFYYGIGGIVTFKNARALADILPCIKDRILLETDAPFLAPVPHRGKRNESRFMVHTALRIAEILGTDFGDVVRLSSENATSLFNIARS